MSPLDDYEDEMSPLSELSDRDLDRLLAGATPSDPHHEDLAAHLRAARAALQEPPDDDARARHLAALLEAARLRAGEVPALSEARPERPAPRIDWRRVMSRTKSLALKLAVATVAATMSVAGLAYAGVDLPGTAAEQAFERVAGIELPNQATEQGTGSSEGSGKSVSDAVHEAIDAGEPGCERGRAVSEAASANRQSDVEAPENDPCSASETAGESDARGEGSAQSGNATGAAQGSRATGEERSAEGRAKAATASGGASEAGADNAGTHDDAGRARAEEASSSGRETGESASDAGAENAGTRDDAGRSTSQDESGGRAGGNSAEHGKP